MANNLSKFNGWLRQQRQFRSAWFAKDPQLMPAPEEALAQLPESIANELVVAINQLPPHPDEQTALLDALDSAIAQWRENPHFAKNSMVVLAHPVSSVSRMLMESLIELRVHKEAPLTIHLLDWVERPATVQAFKPQMKEKLCLPDEASSHAVKKANNTSSDGTAEEDKSIDGKSGGPDDKPDDRHDKSGNVLAVIPNLCWCFLRSADGLEGIDYLQEHLLGDRSQFWVIGSGQVGWEYLNSTLKIQAYCGDTVTLPYLNGEQLQSWLEPLITQFNIHFSDAALHKRLQSPDSLLNLNISIKRPLEAISEVAQEVKSTVKSSLRSVKEEILSETAAVDKHESPKRDYFSRLADISDGVSIVALQLFVQSLRCREVTTNNSEENNSEENTARENSENEYNDGEHTSTRDEPSTAAALGKPSEHSQHSEAKVTSPNAERQLVATVPKLPPLPPLSQSDLYLLYSLILHGDMSIKALAKSLGDAPQVVNNQVQVLRNAGIIEQKDGIVKANPVHYPKLRRELSYNNFIIEVP